MDKCLETRKYLVDWGPIVSLAPMLYYGSKGYPNDGSKEGKEKVTHLQSCDKCKDWLNRYATAEDFERMKRLSQYCCPQMFCAVEEPQEHELSLRFIQFRDEFLWAIYQPKQDAGSQFISYCPWCGYKLPETPFIEDDLGRG